MKGLSVLLKLQGGYANDSYANGRILRLSLLAPAIVEAILDGRQPAEMTPSVLMCPFPVGWPMAWCDTKTSANRLPHRGNFSISFLGPRTLI